MNKRNMAGLEEARKYTEEFVLADELADAAEAFLFFVDEDGIHREALRVAWLSYVEAVDTRLKPAEKEPTAKDETAHLLDGPVNAKRLKEAVAQLQGSELPPVGAKIRATQKAKSGSGKRVTEGVVDLHSLDGKYFDVGDWCLSLRENNIEILDPPLDPESTWDTLEVAAKTLNDRYNNSMTRLIVGNLKDLRKHISSKGVLPDNWSVEQS